jgi:hypothetical protein
VASSEKDECRKDHERYDDRDVGDGIPAQPQVLFLLRRHRRRSGRRCAGALGDEGADLLPGDLEIGERVERGDAERLEVLVQPDRQVVADGVGEMARASCAGPLPR